MKIADIIRKICFLICSILNCVLPIVAYSTNYSIPSEVIIGFNVMNSVCLLIAERATKIEQTLKQLQDDVKTISSSGSSMSARSINIPQVVTAEPISEEVEAVPEVPNTARNYVRVEARMNRQTGAIEYFQV